METEVKKILSQFLKIDPSQITAETIIDKTAVGGSIMVHRLYASLSNGGFKVNDYLTIRSFGQLLNLLNGQEATLSNDSKIADPSLPFDRPSIGIDIELIDNLPQTIDFRNDAFYANNFSAYEISYCLVKENPRASFAGLFAAKEAISKIDNNLSKLPFNKIEISHTSEGKPVHDLFSLSISHAKDYAIAVAVYIPTQSRSIHVNDSSKEVGMEWRGGPNEALTIRSKIKNLTRIIILLILGLVALSTFIFFIDK